MAPGSAAHAAGNLMTLLHERACGRQAEPTCDSGDENLCHPFNPYLADTEAILRASSGFFPNHPDYLPDPPNKQNKRPKPNDLCVLIVTEN